MEQQDMETQAIKQEMGRLTRRWGAGALVGLAISLALAGCTPVALDVAAEAAPPAVTAAPTEAAAPEAAVPEAAPAADAADSLAVRPVAVPWVPPPDYLTSDTPTDAEIRAQLIATRQDLCQDLELASSIILNVGILGEFPGKIQAAAGMGITALENELQVCSPSDDADDAAKSTAQLINEVHKAEWLAKLHLTAMESATMERPRMRPVNADGSFAAFLTLHDVLITQMRADLVALTDGSPTLEEAQQMGVFWQEVLTVHAQTEDAALFPIARAVGDPTLIRSADVIEQEHGPIEAAIDRYMQTLAAVETGQADIKELIPAAREARALTELHFGREEATVIRPLQLLLADEQFRPAVEAQDAALGPWLREHGWQGF